METVVLPAQDHLAQERYRHQSRVLSGMIYPLGGVPRTRRKVRSPQQAFVASLHSETVKVSSDKNNVHVADSTRSGLVSPIDMSMGVLRSVTSSTSTSHLPPLAILKAPQYRLNNASPYGFMSATPLLNSTPNGARQTLRTRSDGELLQKGQKKGVDGERPFSDRRKAHDKGFEGSKGSADRKAVEKTLEKNAEKSSDRRKGLDKKTMERKVVPGTNSSHGDKSSNVQKKAGVITILQRPQTKEAAAENIALFTGRPIEDVTKQILKADGCSETSTNENIAAVIAVKDVEVSSKDGAETENVQSRRGSRTGSPKRERVVKKKPSRDFSSKVASRMAEAVHLEPPRTQDAEVGHVEVRPEQLDSNDVVDVIVLQAVGAQKPTAEDLYLVRNHLATSLNSILNGQESNDDDEESMSPPSERSFNPKAFNSNDRSRNVCPKRERVVKKKPSRDFSRKVGARRTEVVHLESRQTQDEEVHGESRRSKAAFWSDQLLDQTRLLLEPSAVKEHADGVRTEGSRRIKDAPVYGESRRPKVALRPTEVTLLVDSNVVLKDTNGVRLQADDTEESSEEDRDVTATLDSELECQGANNGNEVFMSPRSKRSFNPIASKSNDKARSLGGGLHRGSSDTSVGEIGHALSDSRHGGLISRSGSFRDVSRSNDNSFELFFLPSSPPKNSERWAGPAYTNSPPPSTLPFPTFPLQRVKSAMTEVTFTGMPLPEVTLSEMTLPDLVLRQLSGALSPGSSPPSPAHMETLFLAATDMQQSPFVDPSSATKDLRRILNLDVAGGFRRPEYPEADESATQSLKRMLQLD